MKVLVTGTAGRVGRAIYIHLMKSHEVVGVDKTPCSTVNYVGDIRDSALMNTALNGVEAIIHTAALHAPHVGLCSEGEFAEININATEQLALLGLQRGVKHFIFTSTTALYGYASTPEGVAGWVDETVQPQPKSVYHKSKMMAESMLENISKQFALPITVLQMSRCFPESADFMSVYRLTRGIDVRDVALAHACALDKRLQGFRRYIISGKTPFVREDCEQLPLHAAGLIQTHIPELAQEFANRGWQLPQGLDRVYDSSLAQRELGWQPKHSFESVLSMLDSESSEVLPVLGQASNEA
ncbi:NAD-dependent epimerase/dehydratase family protein [Shewanella nanhaiensis]|uniref:NAD(P)-dependent oxidoreductase n=1 Tax=Shewanella nanhaiensis TaxID=2864872 RepID=A0ABS7E0V0_9GAMM|nr:NAD(P)-dependent oxidoreductase [Shewanella nanhaiensis]